VLPPITGLSLYIDEIEPSFFIKQLSLAL
jgi:hypothetical protein